MKQSFLQKVIKNLRKDLSIEFRNRYAINVSLAFAAVSTLAISLAAGNLAGSMQAVMFWLILFFSAMNGLSHVFIREEDQATSLFLRLHSETSVVFTSKLIFNIMLFFMLQIVITPLFVFFLQIEIKSILAFVAVTASGGFALAGATTALAALVAKSGGRGALFTVISFPVILPVLWIAIKSTADAISGNASVTSGVIFLTAFAGAIISLSFMLFEFIWIEE